MPLDPDHPPQDFRSVLATVDERGRRSRLFVDVAGGVWKRRRIWVAVALIGFYLALPFVRVGGEALLRIDLGERRYTVFGQHFWPEDLIYLVLFALLFVIGTLLLVALLGRVFCGWICPHNVFLEMVFRPLERLFEGPAHRRKLAHERGASARLKLGRIGKWVAYVLVAGALANTLTAIFVGTEAFIGGLLIDPVTHPGAAILFCFAFALILFNFGYFRELTCTFVCPYGRIQAAMLDQHSLGVAYDQERGEPRGRPGKVTGDCVDCLRCVQVCPTGIDIRNGNQLECIHCTACIDACDRVMAKLGRDPGLIRYTSDVELAGGRRRPLRPRTLLYALILTVLATLTVVMLAGRTAIDVTRLRSQFRDAYVTAEDGSEALRKAVVLEFMNRDPDPRPVRVELAADAPGRLIGHATEWTLAPGQRQRATVFLEVPAADRPEAVELVISSDTEQQRLPVRVRR